MKRLIALFPIFALLAVPALIVYRHAYAAQPKNAAEQPYQAEQDLAEIERKVITIVDATGQLPPDMAALNLPSDLKARIPLFNYTYRPMPPTGYELCATFKVAVAKGTNTGYPGPITNYDHGVGPKCFTGQSLYLVSRERAAEGKNVICSESQTSPDDNNNQVFYRQLGTIANVQGDKLTISENPNGHMMLCPYGVSYMGGGKVGSIASIPAGTRVKIFGNQSGYVLSVTVLDPAKIPNEQQHCFPDNGERPYPYGAYASYSPQTPLILVNKNLDKLWADFRDPRGKIFRQYWCSGLSVHSAPQTSDRLPGSEEVWISTIQTGQTVYDLNVR